MFDGQCACDGCVIFWIYLSVIRISKWFPFLSAVCICLQDIFRKYPNKYESIISTLCENLDTLDEPEARFVSTSLGVTTPPNPMVPRGDSCFEAPRFIKQISISESLPSPDPRRVDHVITRPLNGHGWRMASALIRLYSEMTLELGDKPDYLFSIT